MTTTELYRLYLRHRTICTDTRKISSGCLFFALRGESFDGNLFAGQALEKGAAFVVIDRPDLKKDERYILVEDTLKTLQDLARHHRQQLNIPVLAITGTNGKTTTKELLNAVLSRRFRTYATQGNLNNHIGVPLTLLAIGPEVELAIVEMGANHQQEIAFLCSIALPGYGLITNVGKAHLEGFGGFEGVKKAKGELYDFLKVSAGTVFINKENGHLNEMYAAGPVANGSPVYYGAGSDVYGVIVENDPFLTVDWKAADVNYRVKTQLTGSYNLENIVAAISVGLHFGLDPQDINEGISSYVPGNNRSQVLKTTRNTLICDYYNANPSSMLVALDNLSAISAGNKVLILGDMFELGAESAAEHARVLQRALAVGASECILVGKEFYQLKDSAAASFYETTEQAREALAKNEISDATILVKGSRGMKLESLTELL